MCKVHNLPTLHPELNIQFTCQSGGEYLAISKDGICAAIPAKADIRNLPGYKWVHLCDESGFVSHRKDRMVHLCTI